MRADGGQRGIVRDRRAVDREAAARQCFKRRGECGVGDDVVRPGEAAVEHERLVVEQGGRIEARAEFSAHIGGGRRRIGESETAAGQVVLAVSGRMKILGLHGAIGRHAERRQHAITIAGLQPGAVALPDKVRRKLIPQGGAVGGEPMIGERQRAGNVDRPEPRDAVAADL